MVDHIKNFLNKFLELKNKNSFLKETLVDIIKKEINFLIKEEDIEINNIEIKIKTNPTVKNELFIKKDKILKEFNKKTNKNITSIN